MYLKDMQSKNCETLRRMNTSGLGEVVTNQLKLHGEAFELVLDTR